VDVNEMIFSFLFVLMLEIHMLINFLEPYSLLMIHNEEMSKINEIFRVVKNAAFFFFFYSLKIVIYSGDDIQIQFYFVVSVIYLWNIPNLVQCRYE
jgi:hypothetical protein